MKKTIFILILLITGFSYSQDPATFVDGVKTIYFDPLKAYTTAELNAMNNITLGRKAFNSDDGGTTGNWKVWDGTAWQDFVGGGSQTLQQTTDLGATTSNAIIIRNNSTPSLTVEATDFNKFISVSYDRLLYNSDGFNFNLRMPATLTGNYNLQVPNITQNDTIATQSYVDANSGINYTASNGIGLVGNDFQLGGAFSKNIGLTSTNNDFQLIARSTNQTGSKLFLQEAYSLFGSGISFLEFDDNSATGVATLQIKNKTPVVGQVLTVESILGNRARLGYATPSPSEDNQTLDEVIAEGNVISGGSVTQTVSATGNRYTNLTGDDAINYEYNKISGKNGTGTNRTDVVFEATTKNATWTIPNETGTSASTQNIADSLAVRDATITTNYNNAVNRANHVGTQLASTISDLDNAITNNASVLANTAKITPNTAFSEITFADPLNYTHDSASPNKFTNATSNSTITVTTENGESGQLHINNTGSFLFTFVQDGDDLVVSGNNGTLEMWYQHTDTGLKWRVVYLGFNTASGGSGAFNGYTEVVLIGDSITEQAFGQDLVSPNADMMSKLAALGVSGVDVYAYGWGGFTMASILPKIDEAIAAHPDALFIVCIGVNDMKADPYTSATAQELIDYGLALDAVEAKFSSFSSQLCLLPLPYLPLADPNVDDSMFTDPTGGAQPFNEDFYLPRIPEYFKNTDGFHVLDWYNYLRNNRFTHYETDGIHQNAVGEEGLREFTSERLAYLIRYVPRPDPLTDITPTANLVFNVDNTSIDATAVADGDNVDLWTDTINGLNATQTGVLSPTLNIDGATGNREVSFDGTQYMTAGTASDLNFVGGVDDFTIIIKVGENPFPTNTAWWVSKTISTSSTAQYGIIRLGGGISTFLRGDLNFGTSTAINANDLIIWKVTTTQQTLTINDVVVLDEAVVTTNTPNNTGIFTIGGAGDGTNLVIGDYEFIKVYDKALTVDEINIIKTAYQEN